jgi:hypothetical protein
MAGPAVDAGLQFRTLTIELTIPQATRAPQLYRALASLSNRGPGQKLDHPFKPPPCLRSESRVPHFSSYFSCGALNSSYPARTTPRNSFDIPECQIRRLLLASSV